MLTAVRDRNALTYLLDVTVLRSFAKNMSIAMSESAKYDFHACSLDVKRPVPCDTSGVGLLAYSDVHRRKGEVMQNEGEHASLINNTLMQAVIASFSKAMLQNAPTSFNERT